MAEDQRALRTVSALTVGLRGYTSLVGNREPDIVASLTQQFFEAVAGPLLRHQADLVNYRGGEVLAVWNALHDHQRHALSATLAAWEVVNLDVDVGGMSWSVGVATGIAVVGIFGSAIHRQEIAVGAPVSDSERLCALGAPKQVYVDQRTRDGVGDQASLEAVAGRQVQGGSNTPLTIYRVLGIPRAST